jgi:hypothetical protein
MNDLIPAVTKLRNKYNIQFSTMFSSDLLSIHGQPDHIWSSDLQKSDAFFESIALE